MLRTVRAHYSVRENSRRQVYHSDTSVRIIFGMIVTCVKNVSVNHSIESNPVFTSPQVQRQDYRRIPRRHREEDNSANLTASPIEP
jgi:hypothetical protein